MLRAVQPSVGREGWRWGPSGRWGNTAVQCEYNERTASSEGDTSVAELKCLSRARQNGARETRQRINYIEGWRRTIGAAHEPATERDRIQVWLGPVQALGADSSYREILSANELLVLDQIRSPALRNRKLAGRVLLRTALSHAVNERITPREWRIHRDANGRPVIAKSMPRINFSISYAEPVAVVAVSEKLPVGVDVETVEDTTEDMIAAFCCSCEQGLLETGPASQNSREFVRLWTLKEAYTKLVGLGHGIEFDSIGFSLDSLHLLHGTSAQVKDRNVHFETMWVTSGRTLNHVAIAIDFSLSAHASADLQVMSMASADESTPAIHVPNVNILAHADLRGMDQR
jgi:phosphopantetheinyl transferase